MKEPNRHEECTRYLTRSTSCSRIPKSMLLARHVLIRRYNFAPEDGDWTTISTYCVPGVSRLRFATHLTAGDKGVHNGRDNLMDRNSEQPGRCFGRSLVTSWEVAALTGSEKLKHSLNPFANQEIACSAPVLVHLAIGYGF